MATVKVLASKQHHYFTMNVNEVADSVNVSNNTSNVSYSFVLSPKVKGYNWATGSYISYKLYINGEQVFTDTIPNYNGSATVTLKSDTVTIPHNSDGTKTVSFSFEVTDTNPSSRTYTCGNASGSGTQELTTIPRASSFTLSKTSGGEEATSFSLGENIYTNITRASTSFNHKVYFVIGSSGNQVLSNNAGTSANTTLASSLAEYISSTSGTATMYVKTYNGSTSSESNLIGTTTATFTISVPSSVVPSITSVTKSDPQGYLTTYGAYVQGKSRLKVVTVASGNYSTITGCTVKLKNGNTVLNTATATLTSGHYDVTFTNLATVGTITVEVTVTDSRSRTATNSSTITVTGYSNPNISTLTAERRNNDDTVTLVFNATVLNINNANANSKTFKLYKKLSSSSSRTLLQTYTSTYTYSNNAYTETCDGNYAWDFKIDVTDSFNSTPITKSTSVGTSFELINWGSNGTSMGVGKVAEKSNSFECGLDFYVKSINKDGSTLTSYGNNIVSSIKSKNMITGWFIGGLLSTTGAEDNMSTSRRTGYIEVDFTKISTYKVSGMPEASTGIRHFICAYNANKQFLGRTGGTTGTHENLTSTVFTNGTPQGTGAIKYLRVNLYTGADDSSTATVQLEEGGSSTTFYEGKGYGSIFGSNANGFYEKRDDGTLICWNRIQVASVPVTGQMGSLYVSSNLTSFGNFPMSFIESVGPVVTITSESDESGRYCWIFKSQRPSNTEVRGFRVVSYANTTLTNANFTYIAIGRWK